MSQTNHQTDHLLLCSQKVQDEFTSLFRWAKLRGAVDEHNRNEVAARFVMDPTSVRADLAARVGTTLGMPKATMSPGSEGPVGYERSWLSPAERAALAHAEP